MRGKITHKVPMPNSPGTYYIYYEGRKNPGIWHDPNHGQNSNQGQVQPDQGRSDKPTQWGGGAKDGEAASLDQEAILQQMRQQQGSGLTAAELEAKIVEENYYRDQRFREFSDTMNEVERFPEGHPKAKALFKEAINNFPDYLKTDEKEDVYVPSHWLPEKKGK